tara:strand:- start:727 stop:999 length:273 start_codon:yes stop_codon:yes gene_type:complete
VEVSVLRLRHDLKIAWFIVGFIMINVVNNFSGQKRATKHFFRNNSMFVATAMFSVSGRYTIKFFSLCIAVVHFPTARLLFRREKFCVMTV